jgi:hypothetical protein
MHKIVALFAIPAVMTFSLAGCGGGDPEASCNAYIAAYSACAAEAYGDDSGTYDLPDSTCDAYSGLSGGAAGDAADLLDCYTDAYNSGDCSTTDGITAITTGLSSCAAQ